MPPAKRHPASRALVTPPEAWSLAVPNWEERLAKGESLVPKLPLDSDEAHRAVAIFDKLRLPDVPGTPALAEAGGEWFREIVAALLGSVDPRTGVRRVGELFLLAPKKSSKTSYGAALMMTALLMNKRPRAEFLLIAPTQAISDLAFSQAVGMIEADPDGFLQTRMHVREHLKEITDRRTRAKLKVKTFDTGILTGVKPAGVLVDELHEISRNADAARVIGQLRGGLIPNPEAFMAFITTQSDRPPAGAFRAELMKARAIRDGRMAGTMLPVLYELPEDIVRDGRWRDPSLWWMVSPNRGRSMTVERLLPDWQAAQLDGEDEMRRWASQHLNLEIGLALSSDRWAGADFWEACAEPGLTLDALLARCEVVVVGIDGGGLDDLLGLAVLGRERGTRKWLLWSHAWAHRIVLERRKEIAPRLQDFERDGDLTIVNVPGDDVAAVADIVCRVRDAGLLPDKNAIGVDAVGIGDVVDELTAPERGITEEQIVAISQGWKLTGAIKTAERKLAGREIVHGGTKLMAWCVGNAKVEPRGNAITITKQAAGSAKIDPLAASFNCVALMSMNPEATGGRMSDFLRSPLAA
jgi:phage terminase large subunit-like protein